MSQRLNEIMTYGVDSGMIFANPLSGIRAVFKKPKKENMAVLRPDELLKLMMEIANASIGWSEYIQKAATKSLSASAINRIRDRNVVPIR